MKHLTFFVTMVLSTIYNNGCILRMDFIDDKLKVVNNSDLKIGVLVNYSYPDTTIAKTSNNCVTPNSTGSVLLLNRHWTNVFRSVNRITLFLVDCKDIEAYGDTHEEKYSVLRRMSLTKADLDSLGWVIKYP